MKTKDFIKLEDEIKQILIDDPKTRNDDMYLYLVYCQRKTKNEYNRVDLFYMCFEDKRIRKMNKITTFAAVERARRKIQATCPELANERTKKARAKEEKDFKDYSRL